LAPHGRGAVVVDVPLTAGVPEVVVVVAAPGDVVVVEVPVVAVVLVVVVLVDVVEGDVVEGVIVVDVVEVVEVGDGVGVKKSLTLVPLPAFPKIAASGLPEISSTAVTNISASTNTMAAVPAMAVQVNRRGPRDRPAGCIGRVRARIRSESGASAAAEISRRSVWPVGVAVGSMATVSASAPDVGIASVGAASPDATASVLAPVAPSLRSSVDDSGARTTCLTASWPRSMDCATNAVPMVAAAEPMATPMMVPLTPKVDAMSAAITAPAVEARICRNENFTRAG
jgi:hypothetical protein